MVEGKAGHWGAVVGCCNYLQNWAERNWGEVHGSHWRGQAAENLAAIDAEAVVVAEHYHC